MNLNIIFISVSFVEFCEFCEFCLVLYTDSSSHLVARGKASEEGKNETRFQFSNQTHTAFEWSVCVCNEN